MTLDRLWIHRVCKKGFFRIETRVTVPKARPKSARYKFFRYDVEVWRGGLHWTSMSGCAYTPWGAVHKANKFIERVRLND